MCFKIYLLILILGEVCGGKVNFQRYAVYSDSRDSNSQVKNQEHEPRRKESVTAPVFACLLINPALFAM